MEYDALTARHYAAYRPPLHQPILEQGLGGERFNNGLDIGCGTGHSTRALASFCEGVTGVDPSAEMIALAQPHPRARFLVGSAASASFRGGEKFNLFSYAGSLNYQDPAAALAAIRPLAAGAATVLVYDFDVCLQPIFGWLGRAQPASDYDHRCNFSQIASRDLRVTKRWEGTLEFQAQTTEVAHLLLSVRAWREGVFLGQPHEEMVRRLNKVLPEKSVVLSAQAYLTRYAFTLEH